MSFSPALKRIKNQASKDKDRRGVAAGSVEAALLRPDAKIGSIRAEMRSTYIVQDGLIQRVELRYSPGLMKIIDEVITNSIDHTTRMMTELAGRGDKVTYIEVGFDSKGACFVENDGRGIPVEKQSNGKYIPQTAFTTENFSSNYDDSSKRYSGGRNGVGATYTNYFSEYFSVETIWTHPDTKIRRKFQMVCRNNMSIVGKPQISQPETDEYDKTRITFMPDYKFLGGVSPATIAKIVERRVWDISLVHPNIVLVFNDKELECTGIARYAQAIYGKKSPIVYGQSPPGKGGLRAWRFAIFPRKPRDKSPEILSFINGVHTRDGGPHETILQDAVLDSIVKYLPKDIYDPSLPDKMRKIKKKDIRNSFGFVLSAMTPCPEFGGQNKEKLTNNSKKNLKSTFPGIIESHIENFVKSAAYRKCILQEMDSYFDKVEEKTQGRKARFVGAIPGYSKANKAGGKDSALCSLIMCEGLSAAGPVNDAISAMGGGDGKAKKARGNGHDYIGVYALRGKILNPIKMSRENVIKNAVFNQFKKIMGLDTSKHYTTAADIKRLNYGSIIIMTDADDDGLDIASHIVNLIHKYWPELIERPGFCRKFNTPCVKIRLKGGSGVKSFYSLKEFELWAEKNPGKYTKVRYYKGLGSSEKREFREYFREIERNLIGIISQNRKKADEIMHVAFGKDTEIRKKWMNGIEPEDVIEFTANPLHLPVLIGKFQRVANWYFVERVIPRVSDGLKPVTRKILHLMLTNPGEQKVSSVAARLSNDLDYHHGEESAAKSVVRMAQNITGYNNINLLEPLGHFGDRFCRDAAQSRYIRTKLAAITPYIFRREDRIILEYRQNEGKLLEPTTFYPIVPIKLINGVKAIGTGYSCCCYMHDPLDIIDNTLEFLKGELGNEIRPYYHGYIGDIEVIYRDPKDIYSESYYIMRGVYTLKKNVLIISELPVFVMYNKYEELLQKYQEYKIIIEYEKIGDPNVGDRECAVTFKIALSARYINGTIKRSRTKSSEVPVDDTYTDIVRDRGVEDDGVFSKGDNNITIHFDIVRDFKLKYQCRNTNMHFIDGGKIVKHKTIYSIMRSFFKIRLDAYKRRKIKQLQLYKEEIKYLRSELIFLQGVNSGDIVLKDRERRQVHGDLAKISKIFPKKGGYEYLTAIPIYRQTIGEINKLLAKIADIERKYNELKAKKIEDIWRDELLELRQKLENY